MSSNTSATAISRIAPIKATSMPRSGASRRASAASATAMAININRIRERFSGSPSGIALARSARSSIDLSA